MQSKRSHNRMIISCSQQLHSLRQLIQHLNNIAPAPRGCQFTLRHVQSHSCHRIAHVHPVLIFFSYPIKNSSEYNMFMCVGFFCFVLFVVLFLSLNYLFYQLTKKESYLYMFYDNCLCVAFFLLWANKKYSEQIKGRTVYSNIQV